MTATGSTTMAPSLLLSASDVMTIAREVGADVLMDRVIEAVEQAFACRDPLVDDTRARDGFLLEGANAGCLEWMPHHQVGDAVTIKVVSYAPANPIRFGIPTVLGLVGRWDAQSGRLLALADGVILTALRTGAASAVASRWLGHPDSHTLGLVGAGAQAVTQLHALGRVLPIERVLVHDVDTQTATSFAARVAWFNAAPIDVAPLETIERHADVICTATSVSPGAGPVLTGSHLREHVHVNAVGADLPGKIELPVELLRSSVVVPDMRTQAVSEGECQQLRSVEIGPELHDVVARRVAVEGRCRPTVFDSTGIALEDHVTLDVIVALATEIGVGSSVELQHVPLDARNPYDFRRATARVAARQGIRL